LRSYAARGDAAAFTELVRRYADLVYATARRVTGSSAAAGTEKGSLLLCLNPAILPGARFRQLL
jgi:hypothetical protein